MNWTGERVIPDIMNKDSITLKDHLTRYNFAIKYCKGKKVLDASCGSGYGTEILKAYGVDNSREAIEYAKENYKGEFEVCDLNKDFPDMNFDVCVSFETIEHLENPDIFLKNVSKHCKHFICSIPLNCPSRFHKKVYTEKQAKDLIKKYFDKVDWFYQPLGGKITQNKGDFKFLIGVK